MTEEKTGFTVADIERIADLANLELSAVEKETFAHQFENILAYFRKIESVDTENIPAYGEIRVKYQIGESETVRVPDPTAGPGDRDE